MKQREGQKVVDFIKEVVSKCGESDISTFDRRRIIRQGLDKKFRIIKIFLTTSYEINSDFYEILNEMEAEALLSML